MQSGDATNSIIASTGTRVARVSVDSEQELRGYGRPKRVIVALRFRVLMRANRPMERPFVHCTYSESVLRRHKPVDGLLLVPPLAYETVQM